MFRLPSVLLAVAAIVAATLTPALSASADEPSTVELTGTLSRLADEPGVAADLALLDVPGSGLLSVSVADAEVPTSGAPTTVTLAVPAKADIDAGASRAEVFAELDAASTSQAPVEVVAVGTPVKAAVTRSPLTPATHRIFGVLVSPNGGTQSAEQTVDAMRRAVTAVDEYWNQQSSGSIRFTLAATAGWYSSSRSCDTDSSGLWNEAASRVGYRSAANDHLVLFFPEGASCGQGLGSVGNTVNSGGSSWQLGTDSPTARATLAHELGHNMSLGHANWASCSAAQPNPGPSGTAGCTMVEYGDALDVQGVGIWGASGGALSAPAAVRASIWPAAAAVQAPQGTSTHTLNAVSSNTGLRSVIVDDTDGVSYFVEYRNYTDEDAQYADWNGYCQGGICLPTAGVRVLRLLGSGGAGSDTSLIGRTVDGASRASFTTGETFSSQGASGISVTVTQVTGTTATVSVQRGPNVPAPVSQLSLSTSTVARGGSVAVTYSTTAPHPKNWVSIYPVGVAPGSVKATSWQYAPGPSGTQQLALPAGSFPPGNYLVHFLAQDGYGALGDPVPLTVAAAPESVTVTPGSVASGGVVTVDYKTATAGAKNWVGLYPAGVEPGTRAASSWQYASAASGSLRFTLTRGSFPAGDYVAYLLANDGYQVLQQTSFRVTG